MRSTCWHCHTPVTVDDDAQPQVCPQCGQDLSDDNPANETHTFAGDDSDLEVASGRSLPERLGNYEIVELIAAGGMGAVYRARHCELGRAVALKTIRPDRLAGEAEVRRFRAEAEAAATLDHPHIVPIFEVGFDAGQHFFAMGLVEGSSLHAVTRNQLFAPRKAAKLIEQVARAVAYAHEQGIIHRDLKPQNVLLNAEGETRITDFGLAKRLDDESELTATGQIMGTPSYMAPEQAAGRNDEVGPLSDVYALGATLYFMLTGRAPFQAANAVETLRQVLEQEPVSPRQLNPSVDRDLETICLKCLEKSPGQRYESAAAMAADLQRYLDRRPIQARPLGRVQHAWRWCRRNPAVASSLAAIVLISLVATVVSLRFAANAQQSETQAVLAANDATTQKAVAQQREREARAAQRRALESQQRAEAARRATQRQLGLSYLARGRNQMLLRRWDDAEASFAAAAAEYRQLGESQFAIEANLWDLQRQAPPPLLKLDLEGRPIAFTPQGKLLFADSGLALSEFDLKQFRSRKWKLIEEDPIGGPTRDFAALMAGRLPQSWGASIPAIVEGRFNPESELGRSMMIEVAYPTPDGQHLYTMSWKGILADWELAAGQERRRRAIFDEVQNASITPDARYLLVAGGDGAKIDELTTDGRWKTVKDRRLPIQENVQTEASITTMGTQRPRQMTYEYQVKLFDLQAWKQINAWPWKASGVAIHPNGQRAFIAGSRWTAGHEQVGLFEVSLPQGEIVSNLFDGPVDKVIIDPEGQSLVLTSPQTIRSPQLWDVASRQPRFDLEMPATEELFGLRFSPDGQFIQATNLNGLYTWDTRTGRLQQSFPHYVGRSPRFSSGAHAVEQRLTSLVWSRPDQRRVAVQGWDAGSNLFRDLTTDLPTSRGIPAFAGSDATGRLLYFDIGEHLVEYDRLTRAANEKFELPLHVDANISRLITISSDGQVAVCVQGGYLQAWDVRSGQSLFQRRFRNPSTGSTLAGFTEDRVWVVHQRSDDRPQRHFNAAARWLFETFGGLPAESLMHMTDAWAAIGHAPFPEAAAEARREMLRNVDFTQSLKTATSRTIYELYSYHLQIGRVEHRIVPARALHVPHRAIADVMAFPEAGRIVIRYSAPAIDGSKPTDPLSTTVQRISPTLAFVLQARARDEKGDLRIAAIDLTTGKVTQDITPPKEALDWNSLRPLGPHPYAAIQAGKIIDRQTSESLRFLNLIDLKITARLPDEVRENLTEAQRFLVLGSRKDSRVRIIDLAAGEEVAEYDLLSGPEQELQYQPPTLLPGGVGLIFETRVQTNTWVAGAASQHLCDFDSARRLREMEPQVDAATQALQAGAAEPHHWQTLADWYTLRGHPDLAIDAYRRAGAINNAASRRLWAQALVARGTWADRTKAARLLASVGDENPAQQAIDQATAAALDEPTITHEHDLMPNRESEVVLADEGRLAFIKFNFYGSFTAQIRETISNQPRPWFPHRRNELAKTTLTAVALNPQGVMESYSQADLAANGERFIGAYRRPPATEPSATPASRFPLRVYSLVSNTLETELEAHQARVEALAVSADGSRVVSYDRDRHFYLWDVEQPQPIHHHRLTEGKIIELRLSRDGQLAALLTADGRPLLFDCRRGEFLDLLIDIPPGVACLEFVGDTKEIILGYHDGRLLRWDRTNAKLETIRASDLVAITEMAVSPGGEKVAVADGGAAVTVLTLDGSQPPQLWEDHTDFVESIAFANADELWTTSRDGTRRGRILLSPLSQGVSVAPIADE